MSKKYETDKKSFIEHISCHYEIYRENNSEIVLKAVDFIIERLKNETNKERPSLDLDFILNLQEIMNMCVKNKRGFCKGPYRKRPDSWMTDQFQPTAFEIGFPDNDEITDLMSIGISNYNKDLSVSPEKFFMWYFFVFPFEWESLTVGKLLLCYLKNSMIDFDNQLESTLIEDSHWLTRLMKSDIFQFSDVEKNIAEIVDDFKNTIDDLITSKLV